MTTLTAQSRRMEREADGLSERRGGHHGRRRLVLVLVLLAAFAGIALLANYGPLRHYHAARDRLEKAAAEVALLEERTADLQSQLGKLTESGYLEDLAREQLTYALPGEDLYVLTGGLAESDAAAIAVDEAEATAAEAAGVTLSETVLADQPGFLESVLLKIAGLF